MEAAGLCSYGASKQRIRRIAAILEEMYGVPPARREDPLDALVETVLSQNTSDVNSGRAFRSLKERFPSWEAVRAAGVHEVADAIRSGGLADVKAARIQRILERLHRERGSTSLDFLERLGTRGAQDYLVSLEGVGPKTAACTLLFGCGLPVFPVDTHVLRVARRLGLISGRCGAEAAHEAMASMVPPELVYPLHVNMIAHGRRRCRPQRPRCDGCLLALECVLGKENALE
ncbi:MAG: endonuclease III [Bacillota bacterium]|nr:endonuclease III [Bacillota bacterium]